MTAETTALNPRDPLARFRGRLSLPLIAAPMFLVSGVDLVAAARCNGVIGSFPTVNCRSPEQQRVEWISVSKSAISFPESAWRWRILPLPKLAVSFGIAGRLAGL